MDRNNHSTEVHSGTLTFETDESVIVVNAPQRMVNAFDAERRLIFFNDMYAQVLELASQSNSDASFDAYSFLAYERNRILVQPLHEEAFEIAKMVTDEEGILHLIEVGLIIGDFPQFSRSRPYSLLFWSKIKQVWLTLGRMVNKSVREEKRLLKNLETLAFGRAKQEDVRDVCTVCLENFKKGDSIVWLPCDHKFHAQCGVSWLIVSATCPTDRRNAFPDRERV